MRATGYSGQVYSSSSPESPSDRALPCRLCLVGSRTFCLAKTRVSVVVGMTPGNFLAELWRSVNQPEYRTSTANSLYCERFREDHGEISFTPGRILGVHESADRIRCFSGQRQPSKGISGGGFSLTHVVRLVSLKRSLNVPSVLTPRSWAKKKRPGWPSSSNKRWQTHPSAPTRTRE